MDIEKHREQELELKNPHNRSHEIPYYTTSIRLLAVSVRRMSYQSVMKML